MARRPRFYPTRHALLPEEAKAMFRDGEPRWVAVYKITSIHGDKPYHWYSIATTAPVKYRKGHTRPLYRIKITPKGKTP